MATNETKLAFTAFVMTAVIFFVAGMIFGERYASGSKQVIKDTELKIVTDTLTHIIERRPVYITGKARVEYVYDTLYSKDTVFQTKAFVAKLDTAISKDTVGIQYAFPQQTFSVVLRRAADSIRYETKTVYVTNTVRERPWLEYIGAAAIGMAAGYTMSR